MGRREGAELTAAVARDASVAITGVAGVAAGVSSFWDATLKRKTPSSAAMRMAAEDGSDDWVAGEVSRAIARWLAHNRTSGGRDNTMVTVRMGGIGELAGGCVADGRCSSHVRGAADPFIFPDPSPASPVARSCCLGRGPQRLSRARSPACRWCSLWSVVLSRGAPRRAQRARASAPKALPPFPLLPAPKRWVTPTSRMKCPRLRAPSASWKAPLPRLWVCRGSSVPPPSESYRAVATRLPPRSAEWRVPPFPRTPWGGGFRARGALRDECPAAPDAPSG